MEEKKFTKLPDSELEVMQGIWVLNREGEQFISAGLIMKRFPALNRLKLTTVLTLINRLQFKGFITTEKQGRTNCYTPVVKEEEYRCFAAEDFVEKVYLGSKAELISSLIANGEFSAEEKETIRNLAVSL